MDLPFKRKKNDIISKPMIDKYIESEGGRGGV